jgi:hypothetical protein
MLCCSGHLGTWTLEHFGRPINLCCGIFGVLSDFTILPTGILLVLTPIYVACYRNAQVVAAGDDPVLLAKQVGKKQYPLFSHTQKPDFGASFFPNPPQRGISTSLIGLQVLAAAFHPSPVGWTSTTTTAASVMPCLAAAALVVFLHIEHRRAIESSPVPSLYLLATIFLDVAKTRSYFLRSPFGFYTLACLTAAIVGTNSSSWKNFPSVIIGIQELSHSHGESWIN